MEPDRIGVKAGHPATQQSFVVSRLALREYFPTASNICQNFFFSEAKACGNTPASVSDGMEDIITLPSSCQRYFCAFISQVVFEPLWTNST